MKIRAISSWPIPVNASEVKSFIGLCSYYRRYIPSFSDIAQPLYQCSEGKPFIWTPAAEAAFSRLKQALTSAPVLGYPNSNGKFILDTDASNNGIGVVLSQLQDGQERVRDSLFQSEFESSRMPILCNTQRIAGNGESHTSLSLLSLWEKLCSTHRSCSPAMAH